MTSTGGSVGGLAGNNTTRIAVDLVAAQGRSRPTIRTTAAADVNVGLQALNRDPSNPENPLYIVGGTIGVDSLLFDAARAADIMLLGGIDQRTVTGVVTPGIQVFETARNVAPGGPKTTFVTDHFRVSRNTGTVTPSVGIYGTGTTPIPVAWNLGNVYAGTTMDIYKADSVTTRNDISSSVDLRNTASARNLDARTNGSINFRESNDDMRVGRIASSDDNVTLSARNGSLVDVGDDNAASGDAAPDVIGSSLTLNADAGAIGTVANPLDIDSAFSKAGTVYASASGDVNLYETIKANGAIDPGNLTVNYVRSKTANVGLRVASGGILDDDTTATDVVGNRITLTTELGSPEFAAVGTATNDLEIDSSFTGSGGLVVRSAGVVRVTETANELYVLDVASLDGDGAPALYVSTPDTAGTRDDILIRGPVTVSLLNAKAGDDFDHAFENTINANGGAVTVQIDRPDADKDAFGASLLLAGNVINASRVELLGGKNTDVFTVRTLVLPTGSTYTINGNTPSFPSFPGDSLTVINGSLPNQVIVDSVTEGRGRVVVTGGTTIDFSEIEQRDNGSVNDPPVNQLPADFRTSQNPIVLSGATRNAIQVFDPDSNATTGFYVDLTPSSGVTLSLVGPTDGVTVTGPGTAGATLRLTGQLANINAALANGLRVAAPAGSVGPVTVRVVSNDNFPFGALTDTDTLTITIDNVINDPPVNSLPAGPIELTTKPLVLSAINRNALSVSDVDAGNATNFSVTLSDPNATIVVAPRTGVTLTGSGTGSIRLVGTVANINAALAAGVTYTPNDGVQGPTFLTMLSNDAGNTGTGGAKTDTDQLQINVADFNIAPVNTVPPAQTVLNGGRLVFSAGTGNAISVVDIDNENAPYFNVRLTVVVTTGGFAGSLELVDPNSPATLSQLTYVSNNYTEYDLFGTLADINATLATGIAYTSSPVTPEFEGIEQLYVDSNDAGSTGLPGPLTDRDIIDINVTRPPNRPPVNTVPGETITENPTTVFSSRNGNALKVEDPDFRLSGLNRINSFTVTLSTTGGSLRLIDSGTLANLIGDGTPQFPLTLTGNLDGINAALASGVVYNATPGTDSVATITMVSNDAGGYGGGGAKSDTDSFVVRYFTDINDAPINTLPPSFNTDQQLITFSAANGNAISVFDEDAGDAAFFSVRLTSIAPGTNNAKLTVSVVPGMTVSFNGGNQPVLFGRLASINAALAAGVTLESTNPTSSPLTGVIPIVVTSNDGGATGPGGPMSDVDTFNVTLVADVNNPPVNRLPAPISTDATSLVLSAANGNALSVADADFPATATDFTVKLSVADGVLKLLSTSGVAVSGDGTVASPLSLTGGLEQINAILAYGLLVTPTAGFNGTTTLTMVSNDAGRTGAGGALTDTDTLPITFGTTGPVNDAPVNRAPAVIGLINGQPQYVFGPSNGSTLSVTDIDAGGATNFRTALSPVVGKITYNGGFISGLAVTGAGTATDPLVFVGTLANINLALSRGVIYDPQNSGNTLNSFILMESNDAGNTGSGGPKSDLDLIRVIGGAGANTPPINVLPAPLTTTAPSVVLSQANGTALSFNDQGDRNPSNYSVSLTLPDGVLSVEGSAFGTVTGNGTIASPLVLTGTRGDILATLAGGIRVTPLTGFLGVALLKMTTNDNGNTTPGGGVGTPQSDTDYLPITFNRDLTNNVPPKITGVIADGSTWAGVFRDYVDNGFTDPSALGYRIPNGTPQDRTLPWVNVDRLKIQFSEDVGPSLSIADFSFSAAPGHTALGVVPGVMPKIAGYVYDRDTFTATLIFDGPLPTSVIDLKVAAAGVADVDGALLDGEWTNNLTTPASGNGTAGGDFSYRVFVLPGDTLDQSATGGVRNVNAADAQRVRDLQNGLVHPVFGVLGYDPRADLDGNGFINATDAKYSRDQQNAIIVPQAVKPTRTTRGVSSTPADENETSDIVDSTGTPQE